MRVLNVIGLAFCLRLSAVCLVILVHGRLADAQQIQFGFATPTPTELTPPQLDVVSGTTAARLEQARALVAEKNWDEAIDILRELTADDSGRVVALAEDRFVSLPTYCHLQIARFPAEGLAAYRRRVDPLAERWYREGIAERDEEKLRRVVNEMFCSSWGDDALLALGEMSLERADFSASRRSWEQISPFLRGPAGESLWIALRDIKIEDHWPEIEQRWLERPTPPDWLAYPDPDTQLDLAEVRARLALASIRAGQLDRAALELDVLRRLHPTAEGRLTGQAGPYVAALERILASAREWRSVPPDANWTTFAGAPSRSPHVQEVDAVVGPAWPQALTLAPPEIRRGGARLVINGPVGGLVLNQLEEIRVPDRKPERQLTCFPIVVNDIVLFQDGAAIHAADLETGKPAITASGVLYRNVSSDEANAGARLGGAAPLVHGEPRFTLTAADNVVYGRTGRLATTQMDTQGASNGDRLVGIDLSREGLPTFSARLENRSWSFDGVPLVADRQAYVALRHSDVSPHAYVACFDVSSGAEIWRTSIGAADTPGAGKGDETTHNLLTLVDDRIYFNTNLGLVAALDTHDGRICWLHHYERLSGEAVMPAQSVPVCYERDPSPCLYHEGLVVVAPADSTSVFALDAETGKTVWKTDELSKGLHLLGVVGQNLIVGGYRLWAVDVRSGAARFDWPDSEHAGIRGMGRGLVAGNEVFWPTRNEIYVVDGNTGMQTRPPISLRSVGDCGANLAAGRGKLIVAGCNKLMVFGPRLAPRNDETQQPKTALRTGRLSNQSIVTPSTFDVR